MATDPISRVLLVDDDPDLLTIGTLVLETFGGWEVVQATSGRDALARLQEQLPDVVLLDVMMPGMDGLETLARLRELPGGAALPVVFMTAKVRPAEVESYLAAGAVGVVAKPFEPETLPDEVRRLVTGGVA
ncbi:MAG: response regulator [Alphaproteobacteria bacterium]|nr:response regulator [Alphaproteobacteria bacterium]